MHTIKTVFLNESEEPLEKGGPAINIKYPLVPVPGDRLNFDDLNETPINDYIKKTGTSTFIVFSRHLFLSSSESSGFLLFVKPFHQLH